MSCELFHRDVPKALTPCKTNSALVLGEAGRTAAQLLALLERRPCRHFQWDRAQNLPPAHTKPGPWGKGHTQH